MNEISSSDILSYADVCFKKGNTNATVNRKMCALRKLLKFSAAFGKGLTEMDVPRFPAQFKEAPIKDRTYTHKEIEDTLRTIKPPDTFRFLSDEEIQETEDAFITLLDTGARCGEVLAILPEDIEFLAEKIHLRGDKTATGKRKGNKDGKYRTIEASKRVFKLLRRRTKNGKVKPFTMTYYQLAYRLRMARVKAGVPAEASLSIHDIRHYAGTEFTDVMPIQNVMQQLGHAKLTTTQIYVKAKKEKTKAGIEKLTSMRIEKDNHLTG